MVKNKSTKRLFKPRFVLRAFKPKFALFDLLKKTKNLKIQMV
jgi:hypothetical protein